jgi:hypothetical protein
MIELLLRADRRCIVTVDGVDTLLEIGDTMYVPSDVQYTVVYLDELT